MGVADGEYKALTRSNTPGSGLPCWVQSFTERDDARHISHLMVAQATPVKQIEYSVGLMTDHFWVAVRAAWQRNAVLYRTQANPV